MEQKYLNLKKHKRSAAKHIQYIYHCLLKLLNRKQDLLPQYVSYNKFEFTSYPFNDQRFSLILIKLEIMVKKNIWRLLEKFSC